MGAASVRERALERETAGAQQRGQESESRCGTWQKEVLLLRAEQQKVLEDNARIQEQLREQGYVVNYTRRRAEQLEAMLAEERREQMAFGTASSSSASSSAVNSSSSSSSASGSSSASSSAATGSSSSAAGGCVGGSSSRIVVPDESGDTTLVLYDN